jgi:hypothetical protein
MRLWLKLVWRKEHLAKAAAAGTDGERGGPA